MKCFAVFQRQAILSSQKYIVVLYKDIGTKKIFLQKLMDIHN